MGGSVVTTLPEPSRVRLESLGGHIALVTLDRPEACNAIDAVTAHELHEIVRKTEENPDIWTVILTGSGDRAFCAGADLKVVASGGFATLFTQGGGFAGFVHQARTKPRIAAVNGAALAGGMEIALACDLIIAVEEASFGLPEVRRGLIAAAGGLYRLPRALPRALAMEMIATGIPIDAASALYHGLVNRVVPRSDLLAGRPAWRGPSALLRRWPCARAWGSLGKLMTCPMPNFET